MPEVFNRYPLMPAPDGASLDDAGAASQSQVDAGTDGQDWVTPAALAAAATVTHPAQLAAESTTRASADTALAANLATEITRAETAEESKLVQASNLSDLTNPTTARSNLGLNSAALQPVASNGVAGLLPVDTSGNPTTAFYPGGAVVRNYAQEATAGIDPLLASKTPGASTQNAFSTYTPSTHTYVRNPSAFFAPYVPSLTCISAWTSANDPYSSIGNGWRVTAISPTQGVTAHHIGFPTGATIDFVDAANVTHTVTSTAVANIVGDLDLVTFTPALPASIVPATVLPLTLPSGFPLTGLPAFYLDMNQVGFVADTATVFNGTPLADSLTLPTESNRTPWEKAGGPAVTGDSSSAYGVILGGKFVLLGCFYQSNGQGPDIGANATAVETGMGGQLLVCANLPAYPIPSTVTSLGVGITLDTTANVSTNTGGYISTLPGGGHILTGHGGGYISTGYGGGYINTSDTGGFINTYNFGGSIDTSSNGGLIKTNGNGSPNGVVAAPVGSLYTDQAGASGQVLYVKESGSGNTGWVAKPTLTNSSGQVAPQYLGTGTPSSATILRGDGTWAGTTSTGNTIAATGSLLMGDGAGNAAAVTSSADLLRVLGYRLAGEGVVPPLNLLPSVGDPDNGITFTGTINADGTITIPANSSIQWHLAGSGTDYVTLYGYAVAKTEGTPPNAIQMTGNYNAGTTTTPLPGVYRSVFSSSLQNTLLVVTLQNVTSSPITIFFPVLATQDTGLAQVQSYADNTPVAVQPVADLDFTKFASPDRSARYRLELATTLAADSATGSDTNPGTLYSPKLTLASQTVANGALIGLYRGATFRDSLPFSTLGNTHGIGVQDVALGGVKALPIISALDLVTNSEFVTNGDGSYSYSWTPTDSTIDNGGYNNVYIVEIDSVTEPVTPIASRHRMLDVTTQAAVVATPGTVWIQSPGTGNGQSGSTTQWRAIIRPTDSLAPGSGAYRYEVISRYTQAEWGGAVPAGDGSMSGLELVGASWGYGSIGGPTGFVGDRLAVLHGSTHSAVIGGGSLQRSVFYEIGDPTCIQIAWYTADPTGLSWSMNNCLFYANVGDRIPNCLISHSAGNNYTRGDISDCAFLGARRANGSLQGTAIDYQNVSSGTINRVYVQTIGGIFGYSMPLATEVKNSVFREVAFPRVGGNFHDNIVLSESTNPGYPFALLIQQNGANASNNILWSHAIPGDTAGSGDQAQGIGFYPGVTAGTIQRNIIILDPASPTASSSYAQLPSSTAGVSIDYNLVVNLAKAGLSASGGGAAAPGPQSWSAYQAAFPLLDVHSMYVDLSTDPRGIQALFADPLNGDFRWAQTDVARRCAAFCRANGVGPATVISHWPIVPTVDEAVRLLTDL